MKFRFSNTQWLFVIVQVIIFLWVVNFSKNLTSREYDKYASNYKELVLFNRSSRNLRKIKAEIDSLGSMLADFKQSAPTKANQGIILGQIQRLAEQAGIQYIDSIEPLGVNKESDIIFSTFEIKLAGSYPALIKFINQLERATPAFIVQNLILFPQNVNKRYLINADLIIVQPRLLIPSS